MKTTVLLLCALCIPTLGYAQDYTAIVASVKANLQARGVNLSGPCGAAAITVRVAYQLRDSYGLLLKRAGNRAVFLPDGTCLDGDSTSAPGYATDYVIQIATGYGFDLLQDGGGANGPQWMGPESDQEMVQRNRANFAPAPNLDNVPPPAPLPNPTYPPPLPNPGTPAPIPGIDYTGLLQQILASQQALLLSQQTILDVAKDTNTHVTNMDRTITQTLGNFSKFAAKYIAPAVAAWFTARNVGKE